jgi:hypothetical protein
MTETESEPICRLIGKNVILISNTYGEVADIGQYRNISSAFI